MLISATGIDFIDDVEGRRNKEYLDVEGNPTIGVGHLLTRSELTSGKIRIGSEVVKYAEGLRESHIDLLLEQDLAATEWDISFHVKPELKQYQFDALCSFVFNVGVGAFESSTLLKLLNDGFPAEVPHQLRRWNKCRVKGQVVAVKGLTLRREAEVSLWNNRWKIRYGTV